MKTVSTYLEIDFKDEVLESLPRTTRIDGTEVLKRVRASLALKVREEARRQNEELVESNPGFISLGYEVEDLDKAALTYDNVVATHLSLMLEGKVAAHDAEPLPVFQRID